MPARNPTCFRVCHFHLCWAHKLDKQPNKTTLSLNTIPTFQIHQHFHHVGYYDYTNANQDKPIYRGQSPSHQARERKQSKAWPQRSQSNQAKDSVFPFAFLSFEACVARAKLDFLSMVGRSSTQMRMSHHRTSNIIQLNEEIIPLSSL